MAQKNPNGYGGIKKLSGKRRRPYAVVVTSKYDQGMKDISFLQEALGDELYAEVKEKYEKYVVKRKSARQVQKYIGYYENRQDAMIALAEYNRNPYDIDKRNMTFGEIFEILNKEKFSKMKKQTKFSYVTSYKKCESLKNIRMTELRKNHMQKIIDEYSDMSKSTLNNILKLYSTIYKFALENDICEKDYSQFVTIESVQKAKDKVPFSRDEVKLLWDNLDAHKFTDSILVMIYTGMRVGEMCNIRKEDVHMKERYIEVKGTKTKAANRLVPIHKKIAPLIEKRLAGANDCLFPSSRGRAISYNNYKDYQFDVIMKMLGLTHTPHECRHSFMTYAAANELNRVLVKKIVGHSTSDITLDTYTHTFIEDLVKEIDKYDI